MAVAAISGVAAIVFGLAALGSAGQAVGVIPATSSTAPNSLGGGGRNVTGAFISWVPVDDAHGYAHFSVTNSGTNTETAKCSVSVKDDFGDFGFDSLVGETVGPGQTITGNLPLNVGKGSFLINSGEVKNC